MLTQPESACLVIADITRYTSYLAGAYLAFRRRLRDVDSTAVHSS